MQLKGDLMLKNKINQIKALLREAEKRGDVNAQIRLLSEHLQLLKTQKGEKQHGKENNQENQENYAC